MKKILTLALLMLSLAPSFNVLSYSFRNLNNTKSSPTAAANQADQAQTNQEPQITQDLAETNFAYSSSNSTNSTSSINRENNTAPDNSQEAIIEQDDVTTVINQIKKELAQTIIKYSQNNLGKEAAPLNTANPENPENKKENSQDKTKDSQEDPKKNPADPLLVVVLMVKDEAECIVETLKPYVEAGINSYLIYDTGSTDKTIELAEKYFKENNITRAVIKQEPFVDFATSRNKGLELAEKEFPNAAFMLMPDAEWYLQNTKGLLEYCKNHANDNYDCFLVRITNPGIDFYTPRLMRCRKNVRFVGVVHEVPVAAARERVPGDVYFIYSPTNGGIERSRKRYTRDKELLLKEYFSKPKDPRTCFYLAQTFDCLGDLKNAYKFYKKRTKLNGWDEENFMACYRLAQTTESLSRMAKDFEPKKNPKKAKKLWLEALGYYLKAYSMLPRRAEPIIKIADHYLNENEFSLSYLFARRAEEIAYPKNDVLFIDKDLYNYKRHEILSRCAWYIGEFPSGYVAAEKALHAKPDMQHLKINMELYQNQRKNPSGYLAQAQRD